MRRASLLGCVLSIAWLALPALAEDAPKGDASEPAKLDCEMDFTLKGWSFGFRSANGNGVVKCSDGTSLPVSLRIRGAGVTVGKSTIDDGRGQFAGVSKIEDVIGAYAAAEAAAGAVKSASGQVLTKGEVSLALGGKARGWDLGFSIGRLQIRRAE
ncbi:MAG TPA: hypothetical protein VFT98_08910 [Myxococcota bacterium]|nr:hypothetical protein [Myxococcota bacterium]